MTPGKAGLAKSWDLAIRESPESINRPAGERYATIVHPAAQEARSNRKYFTRQTRELFNPKVPNLTLCSTAQRYLEKR